MKQNKLTYQLIWISILLCISIPVKAQQNYIELSDSIQSTIRLRSHLLVHAENLSEKYLNQIDPQVPLAFIVKSELSSNQIKLLKHTLTKQKQIPIIVEKQASISEDEILGLVTISFDDLDTFSINSSEEIDSIDHSRFTINELLLLKNLNAFPDSIIIKLWEQTGKLPNFIEVQKEQIPETIKLIKLLNSSRKMFGVVHCEEQLIADVSWKEYPERKTNGHFCFPMVVSLSPYKAGYQFSPDIIFDSPTNKNKLKEFKALKLDTDYKLSDHFTFDGKIDNLKRDNKNEILNNGVEIVADKERGSVAYFSGEAYIDGGIQSREILKSNFSITAWIKPTKRNNNNSILGKGKNLLLKILNGQLTYTMQGIMDYTSIKAEIPISQWTFVSLVHSEFENRMRYYVNGKLVDQVDLLSNYAESDYTLLIGSNLWEQFFVGYISDIKIWERELNSDEIREEYNISSDSLNSKSLMQKLLIFAILASAAILFFLYSRKLKNKQKRATTKKNKKSTPSKSIIEANEKIFCFGGLQVINHSGLDVARKFSPKLKQLFVLIFLHSINDQKGISSVKLSGYLWPGMDPKNVKNTRGTNIQKLKAALEPCSDIKLVFKDKFWVIEISESCYSDYTEALIKLNVLKESNDNETIIKDLPELISILKKGTLFPNMTESWIDPYISSMSDQIIELGLALFKELDNDKHASLLYELAEVISINDPLNEPALQKKLLLLTKQGKLGLARSVYDNFAKLYFELYQENYLVDFKEITLSNSEKY